MRQTCDQPGYFAGISRARAISREGLYEGLDWLSSNIANKVSFVFYTSDSAYDAFKITLTYCTQQLLSFYF
jgi:hypothetical protein